MKNRSDGSVIKEVEFHKFTHEIKNPLTICNGYLEMILKSSEKDKETYLAIVKEEIERSLNIIKNYSQSKFTSLEKEELDLTYLLEDVVKTVNPIFEKTNSRILLLDKKENYIKGDYEKLKQVFLNLIKNAYEAREGKRILVVIRTTSYPKAYHISIIDNGMGMTREELSRIEEEYYTTKKQGTGLGIPFCKEIINLHNGKLFFESEKKVGTKVTIILPK